MINVSFVPSGDTEFIQSLRNLWDIAVDDSIPEFAHERVTYSGDTPTIPWNQAGNLLVQQFKVMKKVMGGG